PKVDPGGACAAGRECKSGFCADKVCCDRACTEPCEACTKALRGSGVDGTCGVVAADTNPRSTCVKDSGWPGSCLADGLCDGASTKCRTFTPSGVTCGVSSCTAGSVTKQKCNGTGTCQALSSTCTPYLLCNSTGTD